MTPTFTEIQAEAIVPYEAGEIDGREALVRMGNPIQPSTKMNKSNLNGIEIIAGGNIIIPIVVATPILAVALGVGLLISIFQAATQINEQTLTFVPKLLAIALVLVHQILRHLYICQIQK